MKREIIRLFRKGRWPFICLLTIGAVVLLIFGELRGEEPRPSASSSPDIGAIRRLFEEGQWRQGLAALRQNPETPNEAPEMTMLRAAVALETADYSMAFRLYRRLLERFPDDAGLKNNIAWIRLHSTDPSIRDLDRALEEAREAVFARPSDPNIWNTLAEVYLARGDREKARRRAVLARDMARAAGIEDLRIFNETIRRCGEVLPGSGP